MCEKKLTKLKTFIDLLFSRLYKKAFEMIKLLKSKNMKNIVRQKDLSSKDLEVFFQVKI